MYAQSLFQTGLYLVTSLQLLQVIVQQTEIGVNLLSNIIILQKL